MVQLLRRERWVPVAPRQLARARRSRVMVPRQLGLQQWVRAPEVVPRPLARAHRSRVTVPRAAQRLLRRQGCVGLLAHRSRVTVQRVIEQQHLAELVVIPQQLVSMKGI